MYKPPAADEVDEDDERPGSHEQQCGRARLVADRYGIKIHIENAIDRILSDRAMAFLAFAFTCIYVLGMTEEYMIGEIMHPNPFNRGITHLGLSNFVNLKFS